MAHTAAACEAFAAELSALIDAELAPESEAALRAHLADCARCRERLEALCDVDLELAGAARVPAVPADLWERLSARVAADGAAVAPAARAGSGRRHPAPRRRVRLPRPLWSAAIAAAAAAVLYLAVTRTEPGPPLERSPAAVEVAETPPAPAPAAPVAPESPPATDSSRALAQAPPAPAAAEADPLEVASEEDLGVVLELETIEDLDVIANLELLESWLDLQGGASG